MARSFPHGIWFALFAGVLPLAVVAEVAGPEALFGKYCFECHNAKEHKGELDLEAAAGDAGFWSDHEVLEDLEWVIGEGEMPPKDAPQPTSLEREALTDWVRGKLTALEEEASDDPGLVIMPRLNQAEYNNVIRDLTGHDLEPARFFPADQVAENGFANMGAVLNVGTLHAENYLSAAKWVAGHAFISPSRGIVWHPDLIETGSHAKVRRAILEEWYRWLVLRESELFDQKPEDVADYEVLNTGDYLLSAWKYRFRDELGIPQLTFKQLAEAADGTMSPVILERWWNLLNADEQSNMTRKFVEAWQSIPGPGNGSEEDAAEKCAVLEKIFYAQFKPMYNDRWFSLGTQWENGPEWEKSEAAEPRGRQLARYRKNGFPEWAKDLMERARYRAEIDLEKLGQERLFLTITDAWDGNDGDLIRIEDPVVEFEDGRTESWKDANVQFKLVSGNGPVGRAIEAGTEIPAPSVLELQLPPTAKRLRATFQLDDAEKESASIQVAFSKEVPEAWQQLYYPMRQVLVWPENREVVKKSVADFTNLAARSTKISGNELSDALADVPGVSGGFMERLGEYTAPEAHPEAPYFINEEWLRKSLAPQYLNHHANLVADLQFYAEIPFQKIRREIGGRDEAELAGAVLLRDEQLESLDLSKRRKLEPVIREARELEGTYREIAARLLAGFLRTAWRRDIGDGELEQYVAFYEKGRAHGLSFDDAMKRAMTIAMVAPPFIFKLQDAGGVPGSVEPLGDFELASRLSFFLWSSMPDEELLRLASAGKLSEPAVLIAQAHRMLNDPRASAIGREFAGRWLGFYNFDDFSQPDMDKFPEYTETLRAAMYDEAIRFFQHLLADNRPLTELVDADYAFLNEELALHYGIAGVEGEAMQKVALNGAIHSQRGGLFGMGSLLTVTSTPLRSSPIYRGVWVIDRVLGKATPEPPPDVESLSEEEASADGLSIHEQLAQHRADPNCSVCHDRIDPPGLALEKFDAIGRWKESVVDGDVYAQGELKDGRVIEGLVGIRAYAAENFDMILKQFCEKLATFGLGRELTVADRPLIAAMVSAAETNDYRAFAPLEVLITSRQFLYRKNSTPESDDILANH